MVELVYSWLEMVELVKLEMEACESCGEHVNLHVLTLAGILVIALVGLTFRHVMLPLEFIVLIPILLFSKTLWGDVLVAVALITRGSWKMFLAIDRVTFCLSDYGGEVGVLKNSTVHLQTVQAIITMTSLFTPPLHMLKGISYYLDLPKC
ncbi:hypothetical protein Tco_0289710 [Tanacetum coccineum]